MNKVSILSLFIFVKRTTSSQQVTTMAETLRVRKKTPMSLILDEWGIEPDVKYIN